MDIHYIILAYKAPQQVQRLVKMLNSANTYFYIHIDKKVDTAPYLELLKDEPRVIVLPPDKRVDTNWGSLSIIYATLNAMQEVVKHAKSGYTILLSGQCYPIKNNNYIKKYLEQNNGINFIEGFTLPNPAWPQGEIRFKHYTFFMSPDRKGVVTVPPFIGFFDSPKKVKILYHYLKISLWRPQSLRQLMIKRNYYNKLIPHGGLPYWALPIESVEYILRFIEENPDYLEYHKYTLYPEETFFPTIIHNFSKALYTPVTFSCWVDRVEPSPHTFTADWLPLLKTRKELFARKFDIEKDSIILDKIDQDLLVK
jgi:hypothetical protein